MAETLKGLNDVVNNLNNMLKDIPDAALSGLLKGGLIIQRDAQLHVPVEHGDLKKSAYTRVARNDTTRKTVEVGFSSKYAVFVHENLKQTLKGKPRPSGLGVYWGPQGEPKFLQNAVARNTDRVVQEVAAASRVKGKK